MGLTGLIEMGSDQGVGRTALHLEALGENPYFCLLQPPGATCIPWLVAPFLLQSQQWSIFRLLSESDPDSPTPLFH